MGGGKFKKYYDETINSHGILHLQRIIHSLPLTRESSAPTFLRRRLIRWFKCSFIPAQMWLQTFPEPGPPPILRVREYMNPFSGSTDFLIVASHLIFIHLHFISILSPFHRHFIVGSGTGFVDFFQFYHKSMGFLLVASYVTFIKLDVIVENVTGFVDFFWFHQLG
jgi:hypothetical protein